MIKLECAGPPALEHEETQEDSTQNTEEGEKTGEDLNVGSPPPPLETEDTTDGMSGLRLATVLSL